MKPANHNAAVREPHTAMILAAGLGTRMRPITDTLPKALVKVCDKTLLDHGLDALDNSGIDRVVVNVHHHADMVEQHLKKSRQNILISDERKKLLNSGGGIANALDKLGDQAFFILNADSFWLEGCKPNLSRLQDTWNSDEMDILMLLSSMTTAVGYENAGDFYMDGEGRLSRREEGQTAPFAYVGAAIIHPRIFADAPEGAFNLNILFDQAIEAGRLFGIRMEGLWLHVGTPQAIEEAEEAIAKSAA